MGNPSLTTREEYAAFAQIFAPYFLQYLRTNATAVDEIETFDPGEDDLPPYVKSLPALYNYGGVRKTVLVPVEVLGRDARKAAEEARESAANADRAAADADVAAALANYAADRVDDAVLDLTSEKAAVLEACKAATDAAANANTVADKLSKTNDDILTQEEQRVTAEEERTARFVTELQSFLSDSANALSEFDTVAAEKLIAFSENTERLIEEWNAFVVDFKYCYLEIEAQEAQRQENEEKRQEDTAKVIRDCNTAANRMNKLLDNPPYIDQDTHTWWFWKEDGEVYEDSGIQAILGFRTATEDEVTEAWNANEPEKEPDDSGEETKETSEEHND